MSAPFDCAEVERTVDVYLDRELADEDRVELERHVAGCEACARLVREQAAFKARFRAAASVRARLPQGMRARIRHSLEHAQPTLPRWRRVSMALAPAAAAALALSAGWSSTRTRTSPVAEAAIWRHTQDLPIEVSGGDDVVRDWFSHKVRFAVHPPRLPNAALVGARLANLRDRDAAYLVYRADGARVSVFVFDPSNLALVAPRRREAAGQEIYFQGERGYNVALFRHGGVGYAFASDLDEDHLVQLVSSTLQP